VTIHRVALLLAGLTALSFSTTLASWAQTSAPTVFGYRDFSKEQQVEQQFMAVPDAKQAEEHLRVLTAAPHIAGSPEDKATAEYVAQQFRAAGLETEIAEYQVWINYPAEVSVDVVAPQNALHHGPTREHVSSDPFQDDPRVVTNVHGSSPSGDVEAEVVYANYGRPEDFKKLEELKVDVRGKICLIRYGDNYRGVKVFVAQEHGAAGVIIYSDPIDDGYFKGDKYPDGPWRPDTGVQRGSVGYMFMFPGDPTTPGIASVPNLTAGRITPESSPAMPKIPSVPLSYADAQPMLANLGGPASPHGWQGGLPFTYHLGPGPARVKMHLKQDYKLRTIWDVMGKIPGSELANEWVVAGNHRDAWVYGAVDPNSGTAAMLEAVRGMGQLLKSGWRPKRTIVIGSWDAEEEGLMGSTEWAEQHAAELDNAVAYFNMDVAVSGKRFGASAVPSLKQFIRDISKEVPGANGQPLYQMWKEQREKEKDDAEAAVAGIRKPTVETNDVPVGDLGSGSDYTAFLQHLAVPATDISSTGDYGVYHSVFDNFAWFKKFGDPTFAYEQQMARVYGIEVLRMAGTDILPYDYETYGKEITAYIEAAQKKAAKSMNGQGLDFAAALEAAKRLTAAGAAISAKQRDDKADAVRLNAQLREAERAFLLPKGLPDRPWFRHAIYAPGKYTGYAAVVIPGVNEAIDAGDGAQATAQLATLAAAVKRAAEALEGGH